MTQDKKSLLGEDQAEPKVEETVARRAAATARRATEPGIEVPATPRPTRLYPLLAPVDLPVRNYCKNLYNPDTIPIRYHSYHICLIH